MKDIKKGALVAVAVDDAAAPEVVGRELDLDPVTREDPDPVAAHLSGRVPEGLVAVVERDAEEAVPEGFDHLSLHLDLVFLVALLGRNRWLPGSIPREKVPAATLIARTAWCRPVRFRSRSSFGCFEPQISNTQTKES